MADNTSITASMVNGIIVSNSGSTHNVLPLMRFKDYIWPNNPTTCSYSCERTLIKYKYPEMDGITIDDLGSDGVVIGGQGEFFGVNAYANWVQLNAVFQQGGSGPFYHPIFGNVANAEFRRLTANLEPLENYVSYSFEFLEVDPDVEMLAKGLMIVPEFPWTTSQPDGNCTYGTLKRGMVNGWVLDLQKLLKADGFTLTLDGKFGPQTESIVRAYQKNHGLKQTGEANPDTLKAIGLKYCTNSSAAKPISTTGSGGGNYFMYTIRAEFESPWVVANEWHVPLDRLRALNGWSKVNDRKILKKGTSVKIPNGGKRSSEYYQTNYGMSTMDVASACGVSPLVLQKLNSNIWQIRDMTHWHEQLPDGTRVQIN